MSRFRFTAVAFAATLSVFPVLPVDAQRPPEGSTVLSGGVSAYWQFETDLDRGGTAEVGGAIATVTVFRQHTPTFGAGFALRYDYERWTFSGTPAAFGAAPWDDLHRPTLGLPVVFAAAQDLTLAVTPTVQWSYEQGASTGDSLIAGALLSATRRFSSDLALGLGVGVFDDLEETRAFPFVVVNWRIDDHWRLGNPFRAGPAGGAGLELAYRANEAWEFGTGGTWRSARFRLDETGPSPGGIGESSSIPLFLRATWQPSRDVRLDFHAGAAVGGKLTLMDPQGRDLVEDDIDPAPFVGITLRSRL